MGFPPVVMPANTPHGTAADAISGFVQSQMTTAALHFPASVPPAARAFVLAALSADPLERPTAAQLLKHPWLQPEPVLPAPEAVETVSVVRDELVDIERAAGLDVSSRRIVQPTNAALQDRTLMARAYGGRVRAK